MKEVQTRWSDYSLLRRSAAVFCGVWLWSVLGVSGWGQTVITLPNNSLRSGLTAGTGNLDYYRIDVPADRGELVVQTFGGFQGDVDIYLRRGSVPTLSNYEYRAAAPGREETVRVANPAAGSWYILLHAYETYVNISLRVFYAGTVLVVNPGELAWAFQPGNAVYSAPAVGPDGTIYVAGTAGTHRSSLYILDANGSQKDVLRFNWDLYASPVLGPDGTVYQTLEDPLNRPFGRLLAIAPSRTNRWEFSRNVLARHSPALGRDGTLYIASDVNSLYAVSSSGSLKWTFTAGLANSRGSASAIVNAAGNIIAAFYNSFTHKGKILGISPAGAQLWEYDTPGPVRGLSVDAAGRVLFGIADGTAAVYCLNENGTLRWRTPLPDRIFVISPPVIGLDGTIYVASCRSLIALSEAGAIKWRHDSGQVLDEFNHYNSPIVGNNGLVYYATSGSYGAGSVIAVDGSGKAVWRHYLQSSVPGPLSLGANGNLLFGAPDGAGKIIAVKAGTGVANTTWPMFRQNVGNTGVLPPPPAGAVSVTIEPAQAVAAGAQWRIDSGPYQNSGTMLGGLSAGTYTISFKPVTGWTSPNSFNVTVVAGQTTSSTGTYQQQTGSIQVNLLPAEVAALGAKWQVGSGPLQNSGATVSELLPGTHTINFLGVTGWITPQAQTVTVSGNQLVTTTGTYQQVPQKGAVQVTLSPHAAVAAGAQWQLGNGPYQNSGSVIPELVAGTYSIQFKPVAGWITPRPITFTVVPNQTSTIYIAYNERPVMALLPVVNQQLMARFPTLPGCSYVVEAALSLGTNTQWSPLQSISGTGEVMEVLLRSSLGSPRGSPMSYYRLRVE